MEEKIMEQEQNTDNQVQQPEESTTFTAEEKLHLMHIASKVGFWVFGYLCVRLIACTILVSVQIDDDVMSVMNYAANLGGMGDEWEELLSTLKAIPRNGIIASVLGLLLSTAGYFLTKNKK